MEKARGISVSSTALQFNYTRSDVAHRRRGRQRRQSRRHPRSLRLLGGHLPRPHRRRRRRHAHRRGEGSRAADPEAVPGVPPPRHPRGHRHQQVGPTGPDAAGTARRDRRAHRPDADSLFWPVGIAGDFRGLLRRGEDGDAAEYIKFTRTAGGAKIAPEEHLSPAERSPSRATPGSRPPRSPNCCRPTARITIRNCSSPGRPRR